MSSLCWCADPRPRERSGSQAEVGVDLAGRGRPVERVEVQARGARLEERAHSSVAASTPTRRTCSGSLATASSRSVSQAGIAAPRQLGHAGDRCDVRDRHDAGNHRLVDLAGGKVVDEAEVGLDLEEELGDREVGGAELGGEVITVALGGRPTEDVPRDGRPRRPRSGRDRARARRARSRTRTRSVRPWPDPTAGRRRGRGCSRRRPRRTRRGSRVIWTRVWPTHVRCAMGVTGVSLRIQATASWVRTRVPPPAP